MSATPSTHSPEAFVEVALGTLYLGSPVVLVCSFNADRSTNVAPISSAWALDRTCMIGLGEGGQTLDNLRSRDRVCLAFVDERAWRAVEALGRTTGHPDPPAWKRPLYRSVADKWEASGRDPVELRNGWPLVPALARVVFAGRVAAEHRPETADGGWTCLEVAVDGTFAAGSLVDADGRIRADDWHPLLYRFRQYVARGRHLGTSFRGAA